MKELSGIAAYFTGINSWIALAGAALFVFLALFRTAASDLIVNLNVPRNRAAGVVHLFMILVALVVLVTLAFAFVDARHARETAAAEAAKERRDKALAEHQQKIRTCIELEEAKVAFSQAFSSLGSVRCPGGGCPPFSRGNCNRRETWVSYSAPGDYFIEGYEISKGSMNDGNVGSVEVTARDTENRATAVRAFLWCDPSNRPGAGGGWANADIVGTIRLRNPEPHRQAIRDSCSGQFPPPEA